MAKPFSHYNKQTVRLSFKFQKDLLGTKLIFGECLNLKKSHNSRKTDQWNINKTFKKTQRVIVTLQKIFLVRKGFFNITHSFII